MKKLMFVVFLFVSLLLIAEEPNNNESNWISYDGWVTGPGSGDNKNTYLLPFGYDEEIELSDSTVVRKYHYDNRPLLYETDMGWPVPDVTESELKYLFFGDTFFFMRNNSEQIMGKITDGNSVLLDFAVEQNETEIAFDNEFQSDPTHYFGVCSIDNHNTCLNPFNYQFCKNFCQSNLYIDQYFNFDGNDQEEKCEKFCAFDMVETYASRGYFFYDGNDLPNISGVSYNNGTSNIFLAAELDQNGIGNGTQYKINFLNIQPSGSNLNSAQVFSTTDDTHRRSKSIWMNSYERDFISKSFVGIYPRGYFYACAGSPSDSCTSKKLFVPYQVNSWGVLDTDNFCANALTTHNENSMILCDNGCSHSLLTELERQKQSLGIGIYDFEDECRIKFSTNLGIPNQFFPYSFPSCDTTDIDNKCYQDPAYPNRNILWPNLSKMSNMTVIHDISQDIFSIDDEQYPAGYIYFMGTGETEVYTDRFDINCQKSEDSFENVTYNGVANPHQGYTYNDLIKPSQKAYIARVPAYESEIKCAASYEYFAGITNGIARWSNNMEDAEPLYGFYPLQLMEAESIVKHRDLYWMTARLNETDQKGFVVLASPDAFHWQKVDTILFENPESIWRNYAFFWLPPKLIESGDNTMPFLYSIWKNHQDPNTGQYTLSGFLNDSLNPKFTRYNLKSGKYKFMEEEITRAFLVNSKWYGSSFLNTIPGAISKDVETISIFTLSTGILPLPFITFQNLNNLNHANLTPSEKLGEMVKRLNRYVIIEYCYCEDQEKDFCKSEHGDCPVYQNFVTEQGNGEGNWKIIDIFEDKFFEEHVDNCKNRNIDDPDYMCNIPFEHGINLPIGQKSVPVWNWKKQIKEDFGKNLSANLSNVILRFSHWKDLPFVHDNYPEINRQLLENNKLVPYDCSEVLAETDDEDEYPDEDESQDENEMSDADIDAYTDGDLIAKTCKDPSSWRTTEFVTLKYKIPFDFRVIDYDKSDKFRLEYLYPYPIMIHDFGRPGDPAPDIWDMLTADHFAKEFFKVSSFEYAASSLQTLTSGAAATAVIKNSQMQIYAWGGSYPQQRNGNVTASGILYIGTYNPETEVVTFMSEILDETDPNSPVLTAGASMVYDDENDRIYLIGAVDQNGISRIYRLADAQSGRKWESVATIDLGRYFRLVKKSEHEYFAFGGQTGGTSFNTKLYLLDLNNMASPQVLQDIPTSGLANSFAAYSEMDQKLYVFGGLDENGASDRFLSYDIKTNVWSNINVSGGPGEGYGGVILVDYITETISLGGGVFVNNEDRQFQWIFNPKDMTWTKELKSGSYCLKESETTLQGGIGTSGTCIPFTHPWYSSFSAGATVYSLDGKGERLYVGTNNAIKVYDISDPISPVLVSSFSTSSKVNDLEVYGDTLFAATNGGLYKLDASDPDELTQILFISATLNYQYKVEVYNGKLYVGDDNGIKVRDLETLSVLTSVNNGSVLDFAIENGEIGLYKDALFSPVEIRDAETLTLKANEFFGCFEIEVGSSDGRFYLSCDDETYRFEDDGDGGVSFTELSGDIRELQDVYTYNGYTYMYDENTIWISTNNDVPALCGNGIVEGDEVCDGAPIDCEDLDSNYVSGTATCNSTCDGYNTNNCSDDGW